MEKLERIYSKGMKELGIMSLKEVTSLFTKKYKKYIGVIPEDQMLKISTNFTWDAEKSIDDNICDLINRNICEYVGKKSNLINKEHKLDSVSVEEDGLHVALTSVDYTETSEEKIVEFNGDTFTFIY